MAGDLFLGTNDANIVEILDKILVAPATATPGMGGIGRVPVGA
jgi:hypothetical protein